VHVQKATANPNAGPCLVQQRVSVERCDTQDVRNAMLREVRGEFDDIPRNPAISLEAEYLVIERDSHQAVSTSRTN
jgi:hypothetical protein